MSKFVDEIWSYQEYIRRTAQEVEEGTPMNYETMKALGLLKPYTVRLPVTTLAQLEELTGFGPWSSKQEMVFEIIDGAIQDFLERCAGEPVKQRFCEVAEKAFEDWKAAGNTLDAEQALRVKAGLEPVGEHD